MKYSIERASLEELERVNLISYSLFSFVFITCRFSNVNVNCRLCLSVEAVLFVGC